MQRYVSSASLRTLLGNSSFLSILLILTVLAGWSQAQLPALLGTLIDSAVSTTVSSVMILWYALAAILVQILLWLCSLLATHTSWAGTNALRSALVQHLVAQPVAFFRSHGIGELTERLEADINAVSGVFALSSAQFLRAGVVVVTVCGIVVASDGGTAAVLAVYIVAGVLIVAPTQHTNAALWEDERRADAAAFDTLEETLAAIPALQSVQAPQFAYEILVPRLTSRLETHRRASMQSQWGAIAAGIVNAAGWVLAAVIVIWRYRAGTASVGDAVALLVYVRLLNGPMTTFGTEYAALQQALAAFSRCDEIFASPTIRADRGVRLPAGALSVQLEGVTFAYPENDGFSLAGTTLSIPAGLHVAIIGRTGSGKTTLGRLIANLEQSDSGMIRIGGIPLVDVSEASLRQRVGVITQDIDVFPATLRENLVAYNASITDSAIDLQIAALGLERWYASFSGGLDTILGGGHRELTPGEAQLVAVVRVALRQPGLVILDEASAHVDPHTERLLQQATQLLTKERTTITIAHRYSTIEHADVVVVMSSGEIVEQGTPEELSSAPNSQYAQLRARELRGVL